MESRTAPRVALPARTAHRRIDVDGVEVFYRESLPERADAPVLLLLHGFPSASHQFRRLIDALGARYRLIAPDYPGFGHTSAPDGFAYSFDRLAAVTEGFAERLGLTRFALYLFDFGAPVGFRLALRHPERITGLIVQNGNAYAEGLSDVSWGGAAGVCPSSPSRRLRPVYLDRRPHLRAAGGHTPTSPRDGFAADPPFLVSHRSAGEASPRSGFAAHPALFSRARQ
ncbi:alpha/beta fold hydrolase [Streptomyces sp. NPDC001940]